MALINLAEGAIAVSLLRRRLGNSAYFESVRGVAAFVAIAGGVAPLLTSFAAAALATATGIASYWDNWLHWIAGHALGTLTFTPIIMLIMRGEMRAWAARASRQACLEAIAVLGVVAGITVLVFGKAIAPMLFLPLLPMMVATVRLGRLGAAFSVVILTVVGAVMTLRGIRTDQHAGHERRGRALFFQFYIATAALLVLPVAALLRQRKDLVDSSRRARRGTGCSRTIVATRS
jgi:integral membrane sensor domain MASE1